MLLPITGFKSFTDNYLEGKKYHLFLFENTLLLEISTSVMSNMSDCSPPGSSVLGILQATIPEWVAMLFSRGIFPTQRQNPCLMSYVSCIGRQVLYHQCHLGSTITIHAYLNHDLSVKIYYKYVTVALCSFYTLKDRI